MQRVLGNGAVIVKATTPANLDSGVSDVSHYHTSRGTWGTCTEKQSTLGQMWTAPNVSGFSPYPARPGSISRWSTRGQERLGGKPEVRDRGEWWVGLEGHRLSIRGCIGFPAPNLELLDSVESWGIYGTFSFLSMAAEETLYLFRIHEEPQKN